MMPPGGPSILRRRLGRELRKLREARSLRLEDVAVRPGVAPGTLSRIETGQAPARTSYLALMMDLYGVDDPDRRRRLTDIAREGQRKGWRTDTDELLAAGTGHYIGLESAAALVRSWSVLNVPGLLQTRDYATAVIRATRPDLGRAQAGQLAAIPLRRQEQARISGRRLHLIIDQAALHRPVGRPPVMAAQPDHLAVMTAGPQVTIQIAALTAPLPQLTLPFTLLSFADPDDPGVACCDGIGGQLLTTEHSGQVSTYHAAFTALTRAALPPDRSADLIRQLSP